MNARSLRNTSCGALFGVLCGILAVFGGSAALADGPGRGRGDRVSVPVVVELDALGLIEDWRARQAPPAGLSTARFEGAQELLFTCPRGRSLYVTVEEETADGVTPKATGFGCNDGEALLAVRDGLACRNWPAPQVPGGPLSGPSVIIVEEAGHRAALTGECIAPSGVIEPAAIAADLGGLPPAASQGCAGRRSSVTFRGQVMAGGC